TTSQQTHAQITRPNRPPIAVVTNGPDFSLRLGETLALDGSSSYDLDGDPITFRWTWGDGATSNGTSTSSHTYTNTGAFPGLLSVADNRGGIGTYNFTVTVQQSNQPPIISMVLSTNHPFEQTDVTMDATGTTDPENDPLSFEWDFGDHSKTTGSL